MSDLIRDSFTQFYEDIWNSYRLLNENRARIEDRKAQMLMLLGTGTRCSPQPRSRGEYRGLHRMCHGNSNRPQSFPENFSGDLPDALQQPVQKG